MATSESSNSDLKRLSFVASSTAKAYDIAAPTAEKLYRRAKSFVPSIVQPEFARVEEGVSNTVAPLAAKASDACDKLLHYADGKVIPGLPIGRENLDSSGEALGLGPRVHLTGLPFTPCRSTTSYARLTGARMHARRSMRPTSSPSAPPPSPT